MLPLISFETGRKTQILNLLGSQDELRQQMEVWFWLTPDRNRGPRGQHHAPREGKGFYTGAPLPKRIREELFCLLTRTYHRSRVTGHVPFWPEFHFSDNRVL